MLHIKPKKKAPSRSEAVPRLLNVGDFVEINDCKWRVVHTTKFDNQDVLVLQVVGSNVWENPKNKKYVFKDSMEEFL